MTERNRAAALAALFAALAMPAAAADPSALWHIVHDRCVPNQEQHHDPAPCALVDLDGGFAVLKDLVGATQFLLLPTDPIAGIESPQLIAPDARNYLQDAWAARHFAEEKAPAPLAREDLSLAVNSALGRSQNLLHIHIDCLKTEVRDALRRGSDTVNEDWQPFPTPLAGHTYIARRLGGADLAGVNPFLLLAQSPQARSHMGDYTLVVAGASFAGEPGFILLADRADPASGDFGHGETLQDHACALARARG